MADILKLICWAVIGLFRSRASLEAEILALRQQLNVLRRTSPKRSAFSYVERLIFAGVYQIAPRVLNALMIIEPETVVPWHRAGFRLFWRWKSRRRRVRPKVALEIRQLIRNMSLANPLWGAPCIHGELLKLGIDVAAIAGVENLSPQPRPRHCVDGPVCRSDVLLQAALWLDDFAARPTPDVMAGGDDAPDRRIVK
jgi:hypothetical protein